MEEARPLEALLLEDRERAVVAGNRQGAGVALASAQLRTGQDFHGVEPGFLDRARQAERVELVGGFTATAAVIVVAVVDVEGILHGSG